jgi:ribonucleoside-diphosphate reductase alpha chain
MPQHPFEAEIAETIWASRYRFVRDGKPVDRTPADTWARVARAAAQGEGEASAHWQSRFAELMADLGFLPGGRIIAGAGTGRHVTLANCFVMGTLQDDLRCIFDALRDGALTMQAGGGVGYDFSPLRPAGDQAATTGNIASGPVSFMRVWDAMCATLNSTGYRRGAMMATLAIDHPDILQFVRAKADRHSLAHFNCSVLVTDAFMRAVAAAAGWPLRFGGRTYREIDARELWDAILRSAWESSEPGVLFIDRINAENNLAYREKLAATNPCGEAPLPPWGACQLGSFNLTAFVREPFTPAARLDHAALAERVPVAVRMLDNLLDAGNYPLPAQRAEALATRRLGLGFMGLGSALVMLGLSYDSDAARSLAAAVTTTLRDSAYRASIELAAERGSFPAFDTARYSTSPFIRRLPRELRDAIARDRDPQQPSARDRPDRDDQPAREQRLERHRTRVPRGVPAHLANGPGNPHGDGRGIRADALAQDLRAGRAPAGHLHHRGGPFPVRASRDAGRGATAGRPGDLQDHQRPGADPFRRLPGHLHGGSSAGAERCNDLPPARRSTGRAALTPIAAGCGDRQGVSGRIAGVVALRLD